LVDGARVSKSKKFNDTTDDVELNITPAIVVKAGETVVVDIKAALGDGTNDFAVELQSVNASANVE